CSSDLRLDHVYALRGGDRGPALAQCGAPQDREPDGASSVIPVMDFSLDHAIPVLARTPRVLDTLLRDLPEPWLRGPEGPETWSPYDVVGHLIQGERTDWMPRVEHLLTHGETKPFK